MFRRAIIHAFPFLLGTLAATAAPLNMELKNTTFQPGTTIKAPLLKPAQVTVWHQSPRWTGGKMRKNTPSLNPRTQAGLTGLVMTRADEAGARPASVWTAGGRR
jgi:hypothetical protein